MIRAFIETEGYNMIAFIWDNKMICCDCETIYEANEFDYSGIVDCKTAEQAAEYCAKEVIPFHACDYNNVTYIGTIFEDYNAIESQSYYLKSGHKYLQAGLECYFGELSDGTPASLETINEPVDDDVCVMGYSVSPDLEYLVCYRVVERCDENILDSKIEIVDVIRS